MRQINLKLHCGVILLLTGMLAAGVASADKPSWAGGGGKGHKGHKGSKEQHQYHESGGRDAGGRSHDDRGGQDERHYTGGRYFDSPQRTIVRDYYAEEFRSGHCPPGLAKKHNGCMPPGQARKWAVGERLPPDVIYYDLPPYIAYQMGPPPPGYKFVRVATDILMIATGTGMIMDAILDLGGL